MEGALVLVPLSIERGDDATVYACRSVKVGKCYLASCMRFPAGMPDVDMIAVLDAWLRALARDVRH
jgi:hypothetical protein